VGGGFEQRNQIHHCKTVCIKGNLYLINYNSVRTWWTAKGNSAQLWQNLGMSGRGGLAPPPHPRCAAEAVNWMTDLWFDSCQKQDIFLSFRTSRTSLRLVADAYSIHTGGSAYGVALTTYTRISTARIIWSMRMQESQIEGSSLGQLPQAVDVRTHPPRRTRRSLGNCVISNLYRHSVPFLLVRLLVFRFS
jgi:hypothetical protein